MSSQNQIDANRRNAQFSTGPRTEEGKAAVSQNAFKHGYRSDVYRSYNSDPSQFDALYAALRDQLQPRTTMEEIYVERIAISHDKLAFLETLEGQCEFDFSRQDRLPMVRQEQRRLEASLDRAANMLLKLQKARQAGEVQAQVQARNDSANEIARIQQQMAVLSMIRTPAQVMAYEEAEAAAAESVACPDADDPAAS